MQQKELVLRILRLNLIPAPRVIAPGPFTEFPVLYVDPQGSEQVVKTLSRARTLSKAVAGVLKDTSAGDFFMEILPVRQTIKVAVTGLRGESDRDAAGEEVRDGDPDETTSLAVRATYALGLDRALVIIGLGTGGPWVLSVEPVDSADLGDSGGPHSGPRSRIRFLGAKAEFIAVDPRTGLPLREFFEADVDPDGELTLPSSAMMPLSPGGIATQAERRIPPETHRWVSSPLPFPDMPLSTRLVFQGVPTPAFLRALDRSVAVMGMMACRPLEARQRSATGEGLLGSYRLLGAGCSEYTTVPSLLGNPPALKLICRTVEAIVSDPNAMASDLHATASDPLGLGVPPKNEESWISGLERTYRWQRAYYHADKAFFRTLSRALSGEDRSLAVLDVPSSGASPDDDFRPAWGLNAPAFDVPCVTVGTEITPDGCRRSDEEGFIEEGVTVTAGTRSVLVGRESVLAPDPLEDDDFRKMSSSWASGVVARPNSSLACRLALPEGAIMRTKGPGLHLRIGPVVGIMAPEFPGGQRFGIETDRFRRLIGLGAEMGLLVYVFFPDIGAGEANAADLTTGSDLTGGIVKGWTYREGRGWSLDPVPLPDVVYDRYIPDVVAGPARDVARAFSEAYPQAVFLNSLPLVWASRDKLRTHEILSKDPEIAPHLPLTQAVKGPSDIARFAAGRSRSFLKLRGGTGSKGLSLIENLGSTYRVTRREKGVPPTVSVVRGEPGLARFFSGLFGREHAAHEGEEEFDGRFIIQEAIDTAPLPKGAGGAFEVRVVYQKGGAGVWMRTGMVARLNPDAEGFMVAGVELHHKVGDILDLALPGRANAVKAEIRRIARMIPPALERGSGRGGELSVDFGIDKNGKPWLIEVNSKPATLFRDIGAFELRNLSLLRVLNYAVALYC